MFQMHIRAVVFSSPRRDISIWMLQVTVMDLFTSLPVRTEAGRFLMVSTAVPFFKIAGQGAVVGHIADGQAGQRAGDAHLGHLLHRQGQGYRCRWLGG